ncbi:non-hydrolyzing UDP-N-acetylglucosamine 2-epimerase [Corynebacterium pygosceleis]|uniref:non-hydrolyzing UDP-N-acetylglucosamine 2-epimerase n=1 Tax=Corynebacterium pygosceleis TaxID=2800406 RepID=UPI00200601C5|nr:UDP-N-acetylglucosamine 2-epimerase (non-hydrolyzing) [Corynebacterium pygosceleis]
MVQQTQYFSPASTLRLLRYFTINFDFGSVGNTPDGSSGFSSHRKSSPPLSNTAWEILEFFPRLGRDMVYKVAFIFGTRPELIKIAPVAVQLDQIEDFCPTLISTGQHTDLVQGLYEIFDLPEVVHLDQSSSIKSLPISFGSIYNSVANYLDGHSYDLVIVQGDTSTALAGAQAAFFHRIPLVHLEAGLRSRKLNDPFPEEANRRLISKVASLHLAPSLRAKQNLLVENVDDEEISITGNTGIDALHQILKSDSVSNSRVDTFLFEEGVDHYLLVTVHRRENWSRVSEICSALRQITEQFSSWGIVVSMHANPVLKEQLRESLAGKERILLLDPVPYPDFIKLMSAARIVLSDSGGVQEEAPALGVPLICMRENTEREEVVESGNARLVGSSAESIVQEFSSIVGDPDLYARMATKFSPYGSGEATAAVIDSLRTFLSGRNAHLVHDRDESEGATGGLVGGVSRGSEHE